MSGTAAIVENIPAKPRATMTTTSESLLLRLQDFADRPDEQAWERFVTLYTPLIFYWARGIGLNQTDAADLVQDVLTRVFQKLPQLKYDSTKSLRGWLRTVTINRYRELRRRKSSKVQPASESMIESLAPVQQAESTWDIDYARLLVAQAMESMKDDFKVETWRALERVMKDAESVDAAAKATGVSPWTIYSAKSRLMKRLRDELEGLL